MWCAYRRVQPLCPTCASTSPAKLPVSGADVVCVEHYTCNALPDFVLQQMSISSVMTYDQYASMHEQKFEILSWVHD